jgi:hypothetical protein
MRFLRCAILAVVLGGCAVQATLPGPPEVRIIPPPAGLAPELAAFSGTWEGTWDGVLASRLIVESMDADSAVVVYAWADDPGGFFKAGWSRYKAQVLPGGKLQFGSSETRFTFSMAPDRMSIRGGRERGGRINSVTMKKVVHAKD